MGVYSSYMTALTEWRRGQTDWNNRRFEDPDSEATFAAAVESYRLKGVARGVLAQIRLVTSDPAIVADAISAFELTRPIHYAQDSTDQRSRTNVAEQAIEAFAALAASEVQSAPLITRGRRTTAIDRPKTDA